MDLIGRRWQADPLLRRIAQAPVHSLAAQSRTLASLRVLDEQRFAYVCAAAPQGHTYLPEPADPESIARTATGRVLYASEPARGNQLPDCWTGREWQNLRNCIRDPRATVVDYQDFLPGVCCVSAPVWWPDMSCAGAVTAVALATKPPLGLADLVWHTARRIGAGLRET